MYATVPTRGCGAESDFSPVDDRRQPASFTTLHDAGARKRVVMPITESDRLLFSRVWAVGAKAVKDGHISALLDVTLHAPTLEQYQDSHGQRMTDMIKVVQLGISKLRDSGEHIEGDEDSIRRSLRRSGARYS